MNYPMKHRSDRDLSHNNLSGSIPYLLGQGPSPLKFLDLSSNNLSGPIPKILLEKSQRGLLTPRIDNNPNLCGNYYCDLIQNKKNKTILQIVLPAIAAIALLFVALLVLVILPRRKKRPDAACSANPFENRTFKYKELKLITKNFNTVIGKGGFGHVYLGHLENGTPVAVKMRSKTSSQGNTEFLAEAQHLSRVHHRNLVSLIGYCKDKEHLSLVYEYMDGGNLQDRLRGFISIDCGNTATPKYTDNKTGLSYVNDEGFTDAGLSHTVDLGKMQRTGVAQRYSTVRLFPNGTRNCYTLRSLTAGGKYFVRAVFGYGNYDGLNRLPTFDLYFGVNYWTTVTIVNSSTAYVFDTIAVSPANYLQICLVNIGSGTPFISGLDLRPLAEDLYPEANVNQSLVLLSFFRDTVDFGFNRYHFGTNDHHIRYPDDSYDRMWQKFEDVPSWTDIPNIAEGIVQNPPNSHHSAPSAVMRSASTPLNVTRMDLWWSSDSSMSVGVDTEYYVVLYFTELVVTQELRQFHVMVDNYQLANAFSPKYFLAHVLPGTVQGSARHVVTLVATSNSTLPPLISAMEIYIVRPVNESITDSLDANSMMTIQMKYSMKRNWVGDPCAPRSFVWDGLNCSYAPSGPPRITALNLASSGLVGEIDASFGQLTLLQHLDLSRNNLSGSIPDFLGQVPSLTFLDLSSNDLSGPIPRSLLEKSQDGLLTLRIDNNPILCGNYNCNLIQNKKKNKTKLVLKTVVPAVAAISLLSVALLVLVILRRRKKRPDAARSANPFENRRFKYKELKLITNNFNTVIGKGGFGPVYAGRLENGTPVAVKMRSDTSSQGNKEFLAEAQHLARVHHRNLVSLIGYCKDKKHLSLVYEYMDGGNLQDRLRGEEPLNWLQRLKIALDSAYGLEYLHKSCSPPLIHRDVKTGNILLTANLEAKLADFGLTRAFSSETRTHTTTQPAGTFGYLDPEYYATSHLSEKSDVYSFGVVLLVLITARPAIMTIDDTERMNIVLWAREWLSEGDIESVIDPSIRGDCDINSVWKVAELALQCTQHAGRDRPTMVEVVEGIIESLQLETSSRSMRCSSIGTGGSAFADGDSVGALEAEPAGARSLSSYLESENC